MKYNNFRKLFFIPSLLAILVLASCQKGIDPNNPDPVIPDELKDSTLLIKSITSTWEKGTADEETLTEFYSYDTINKKITITWNDPSENYIADGSTVKLSYNTKGLLTRAEYNYPAGYVPWEYDYNTIDLAYDAGNVLQNITVKYSNASIESIAFTKTTPIAGKYQLTWDQSDLSTPGDKLIRRAVFDDKGKNIINVVDHSYLVTDSNGDEIFTNFIITDSITYDESGSVIKVFSNRKDTLNHTSEDYISADYTRLTKGDQLYNQRQALLNGVANIPFGDFDSPVSDAFGILSFSLDYEFLQYSKYPIQTAKMHTWSDYNFTASSEFDSKDRLTKFIGFFLDNTAKPQEYQITYFK